MNTNIQNSIKIMNETTGRVAGIMNTINNKFNKAKRDCPMDKKTFLIIGLLIAIFIGFQIRNNVRPKYTQLSAAQRDYLDYVSSQGSNIGRGESWAIH